MESVEKEVMRRNHSWLKFSAMKALFMIDGVVYIRISQCIYSHFRLAVPRSWFYSQARKQLEGWR